VGSSIEKNDHILQEYRSGFRILRMRSIAAEEALAALLPDPDRIFEQAEIFKPGTRTHAGMVTVAGRRYFLKRYNCRGWLYRLHNAFRRSRAVRTWVSTWGFVARGLPVPQPLLCLEERRFRLLGRSYILMEFAAEKERLVDILPKLDAGSRQDLLAGLGSLLGRMHRLGCLHGDLKWSNILVGPLEDGERDVCLVDLDGSRILKRPKHGRMLRDLRRFCQDLEAHSAPEEQARFYQNWRKSI
jgi:tRNA A-37 threonylcarbamoyl transferase component Bud32